MASDRVADHRFAVVREETERRPLRQTLGSDRRVARLVRQVRQRPGHRRLGGACLAAGRQLRQGQEAQRLRSQRRVADLLGERRRAPKYLRRPLEALGDHVLPPDDRQHLGAEPVVAGELAFDDDLALLEKLARRILAARGSGGAQEKTQEVLDGVGPCDLGSRLVALSARFAGLPEDGGRSGDRRDDGDEPRGDSGPVASDELGRPIPDRVGPRRDRLVGEVVPDVGGEGLDGGIPF